MSVRTCEKCGSEPGSPYTFLYGTTTSTPTGPNTTRTVEEVKGTETVYLGERCLDERRAAARRSYSAVSVISSIVMLAAIGMAIFGGSGLRIVGILGAAVALVPLIFSLLMRWVAGTQHGAQEALGVGFAIELRRMDLRKQGYPNVWTKEAWANKVRWHGG
ncbi:MAG: hypothetical protein WD770_09125 [Actinomycetota bacterium]